MAIQFRRNIGGARATSGGGKDEVVSVWERYYPEFMADIETAIEEAKGRYGYTDADGTVHSGDAQEVPAPSTFWKVDTKDVVSSGVKTKEPLTYKIEDGGKIYKGEKVIIALDIAGRLVKGMFPVRTRKVKGKEVPIKNSEDYAIVPSSLLVETLEDIKAAAEVATKDDGKGSLGAAMHQAMKDVSNPANRVPAAQKAAKEKERPWNDELDCWMPASK